ncbi:uncharacterized protein LOC111694561 [Trichogramma pretiosum]|uniref:uncharacterized protein LOC111694561 n=1 Tax=Trichogramma pretiosum TaxID=7493 RepID=UPI000C71AA5E|nr:uncharacterized protein LOC111694561 [Trichogramma pretiosum]
MAAQENRIAYIVRKGEMLEKHIENLNKYISSPQADPVNANLRLANVSSLYKDYMKYNDELMSLKADHPRIDVFFEIEANYYEVATQINKMQNIIQNSSQNASNVTIIERQDMPKLPTVKIPTFDGSREKWLTYKNKFIALVHSRTDISNLVKHTQLESSLSGPALSKIAEFPASEENYSRAWQALLDSYDQKRIMVSEHLDAIIDLPFITKSSATELSSLMDTARQHASMLEQLEVKSIDQLIIRHIERCLPAATRSRWEERLDVNTLPTLNELYKFVQASIFKLHSLERNNIVTRSATKKRLGENSDKSQYKQPRLNGQTFVTSTSTSCPKCLDKHRLYQCPAFERLNIPDRWEFIKTQHLCRNCLNFHKSQCTNEKRCKKCNREHHTLLHADKKTQLHNDHQSNRRESVQSNLESRQAQGFDSQLMTTAVVNFKNRHEQLVAARVLLDSCSTVNLMTKRFAEALNLPKQNCMVNIGALNDFLIVPTIADFIPNEPFPRELFNIPKNIQLADPQFHSPKPIDVLLASRTTLSVLAVGQIKCEHDETEIVLQKTCLGWVVAGGSENMDNRKNSSCNIIKLDKIIEQFWTIEDLDHEPSKTRDELVCERHYSEHTQRNSTGKYIVRLPFRDNVSQLGESRLHALKRFHNLERTFKFKPSLRKEYERVMNEYISLGHMSRCDDSSEGYFLPHHAVIKEASETTKVRVVFDASAKTSTGISLNDVLMVGPTIQDTIMEQLLRFRTHRYVITADIEKMYRQILIHPDDRKFQKTFWYDQGQIKPFQLNTVTFGTASAPYLAIRTIQQLARDEAKEFPKASQLLLRDFYVDDFISGANSIEEITTIRDEMIELLSRGGFTIR